LWRYATEEFLTFRIETEDETRSRWPIDPRWHALQRASMLQHSIGVERMHERRGEASLDWWMPRVRGSLVAIGALHGAETLEEVLALLPSLIDADEARYHIPFERRLERRRWELGFK
jgi:hypothetical protein